jgi:hypothetical protein
MERVNLKNQKHPLPVIDQYRELANIRLCYVRFIRPAA